MRSLLLLVLLLGQVFVFASIEGTEVGSAGGAPTYYGNYLMQAVNHSGPLLLLTLGMALAMAYAAADLSVAATAALIAAVMSRCPSGAAFWYVALPVALAAALAAGGINAALVRRLRLVHPVLITVLTMLAFRLAAWPIGDPDGGPFLAVSHYWRLGTFEWMVGLTLAIYAGVGVALRAGGWRGRRGDRASANESLSTHRRLRPGVYALVGGLMLPAAVWHTARVGSAEPGPGLGFAVQDALIEAGVNIGPAATLLGLELQAVVAAMLGGVMARRARFSLLACALAAANFALFDEGMRSVELATGGALPAGPLALQYGVILMLGVALFAWNWRMPGQRRLSRDIA